MSIASELTNLEGNIEDSYDAVNDMGGIIPAQRNMDNLDQAIRTIPQNTGTTYTAGTGIDIDANNEISVDNTTVPYFSDLATVATTGDYGDLLNTPTIPAAQIQSDWTQATTTALDYIKNKPSLATVATSGLYSDLTGTPSLATVATSGDYGDLLNKPTIPTVNDATLTIQHNGTNVQTFTANQSTNATANIETIWADDVAPATQVPPITSNMIDWSTMGASVAIASLGTPDRLTNISNHSYVVGGKFLIVNFVAYLTTSGSSYTQAGKFTLPSNIGYEAPISASLEGGTLRYVYLESDGTFVVATSAAVSSLKIRVNGVVVLS